MGRLPGMPDDFTVRPYERAGALEVAVAGDLDMAAAFKLESAVEPVLAAGDVDDPHARLHVQAVDTAIAMKAQRIAHERPEPLELVEQHRVPRLDRLSIPRQAAFAHGATLAEEASRM